VVTVAMVTIPVVAVPLVTVAVATIPVVAISLVTVAVVAIPVVTTIAMVATGSRRSCRSGRRARGITRIVGMIPSRSTSARTRGSEGDLHPVVVVPKR